ncbi:hypothetical protein ACFZAD_29880 [Streptomyces iakyrus]|uniref:hypothetical protein n=1 Tax=Streptomyces iakyrus TaxID=68219 RepID=UPI0036EF9D7B
MSTAEEAHTEVRARLRTDPTDDVAALRGCGEPMPGERAADRTPRPETAQARHWTALRRPSPFPRSGPTCTGFPETRRNITAECVLGLPKEVHP